MLVIRNGTKKQFEQGHLKCKQITSGEKLSRKWFHMIFVVEYLEFESTDRKKQVDGLKRISEPHYWKSIEMSEGGSTAELVLWKVCGGRYARSCTKRDIVSYFEIIQW